MMAEIKDSYLLASQIYYDKYGSEKASIERIVERIEADRAAQRQAGRDEEREDIIDYCREAGHRDVLDALEEYNEKQKALADLDEARKG